MTSVTHRLGERWFVAMAVLSVLLGLGACGSDTESKPVVPPASARALLGGTLDSYCAIQGIRQMIADGKVKRSTLPEWVDKTEVNGTPLIIDFKKASSESKAALEGRLYASAGFKNVRPDDYYVMKCMDNTTNADVEHSQGGPSYYQRAQQ